MIASIEPRLYSSVLPEGPLAVPLFEDWLDTVSFSDRKLEDRVKLAGEEILDNLIRHSGPLAGGSLRIELRVDAQTARLTFHFRSAAFRRFARSGGTPKADYDARDRRWRGLGLFMIGYLTRRVAYHTGLQGDRIEAEFGAP